MPGQTMASTTGILAMVIVLAMVPPEFASGMELDLVGRIKALPGAFKSIKTMVQKVSSVAFGCDGVDPGDATINCQQAWIETKFGAGLDCSEKVPVGTRVNFVSCPVGYAVVETYKTITCKFPGKWDNDVFTCDEITTEEPSTTTTKKTTTKPTTKATTKKVTTTKPLNGTRSLNGTNPSNTSRLNTNSTTTSATSLATTKTTTALPLGLPKAPGSGTAIGSGLGAFLGIGQGFDSDMGNALNFFFGVTTTKPNAVTTTTAAVTTTTVPITTTTATTTTAPTTITTTTPATTMASTTTTAAVTTTTASDTTTVSSTTSSTDVTTSSYTSTTSNTTVPSDVAPVETTTMNPAQTTTVNTTTQSGTTTAATGWNWNYNNETFKRFSESSSWDHASDKCRAEGAILPTFSTQEQLDFLLTLNNASDFLIGMNDKKNEGIFVNVDATPIPGSFVPFNKRPPTPILGTTDYDCVKYVKVPSEPYDPLVGLTDIPCRVNINRTWFCQKKRTS